MELNIVNKSGLPDDADIYIGILGQDSSLNYGYLKTVSGVTTFTLASGADSVASENIPFYSLKDLNDSIVLSDHITSANVFVSILTPMEIPIWESGYTEPTFTSATATDVLYDKVEFTYGINGVGAEYCKAKTTCEDFFAIPMTLALTTKADRPTGPVGIPKSKGDICKNFLLNTTLSGLILEDADGLPLRILSASSASTMTSYLKESISEVWDYYASETLTLEPITLGNETFTFLGKVNNNAFTFTTTTTNNKTGHTKIDDLHTIKKPTTKDVFGCNGKFKGLTADQARKVIKVDEKGLQNLKTILTYGTTKFEGDKAILDVISILLNDVDQDLTKAQDALRDIALFMIIDANIKKQVAAALNRGILPLAKGQKLSNASRYYPQKTDSPKSNLYAATLHKLSYKNLCYGFPFDDECKQSSDISLSSSLTLTLTIDRVV